MYTLDELEEANDITVTIPEINTLYDMANERLLNAITDNRYTVTVWISDNTHTSKSLLVHRINNDSIEFKDTYHNIYDISNQSLAHLIKFASYVVDGDLKTIEINMLLYDIALSIFTKTKKEEK